LDRDILLPFQNVSKKLSTKVNVFGVKFSPDILTFVDLFAYILRWREYHLNSLLCENHIFQNSYNMLTFKVNYSMILGNPPLLFDKKRSSFQKENQIV
jgi:hypothetical protein